MRDDRDERKGTKKKFQLEIHSWMGKPNRDGVWVRETVATNVRRTYEHYKKGKGWSKKDPVVVKETVEEICYVHHGYRPKFDSEKTTRKAFYFRGARVWRT